MSCMINHESLKIHWATASIMVMSERAVCEACVYAVLFHAQQLRVQQREQKTQNSDKLNWLWDGCVEERLKCSRVIHGVNVFACENKWGKNELSLNPKLKLEIVNLVDWTLGCLPLSGSESIECCTNNSKCRSQSCHTYAWVVSSVAWLLSITTVVVRVENGFRWNMIGK